jgi:LacI family transcriptional regulator
MLPLTARPSTIKDIARQLGVSASTVSRALNNQPCISPEMKEKVHRAANKLNYVPNLAARRMRHERSLTVGLLVPDICNNFYSLVASCLSELCRPLSFQLVLGNTDDDPEAEAAQTRALVEARVSGIVIAPSHAPLKATISLLRSVPVVQLHRHVPAIAGDMVYMDETAGVRAAALHLLEAGHRSVAYAGTRRDISTGKARLRGFIDAHREFGIEPDREIIHFSPPRAIFGRETARRILTSKDRPTAVLMGSTELTLGAVQAITEAGLDIPQDISVIGYGDAPWCSLLSPPLSVISLPYQAMAQQAAQIVFQRITKHPAAEAERIILPPCSCRADRSNAAHLERVDFKIVYYQ